MKSKKGRIYTIYFEHNYVATPARGDLVTVHVCGATSGRDFQDCRKDLDRETKALRLLKGLSAPRLVTLPAWARPLPIWDCRLAVLVKSTARGKRIELAGLTSVQKLEAWCLIVRQFAEFRRRKVIVADVSSASLIIVRRSPLEVRFRSLERSYFVTPGQRFLHPYKYNPAFAAPELLQGAPATESSLVYELGILLPNLLTGYRNGEQGRAKLDRAFRELRKLGASQLVGLLKACLSPRPRQRPAHFGEVWKRLQRLRLPVPPL